MASLQSAYPRAASLTHRLTGMILAAAVLFALLFLPYTLKP